MKTLRIAGTSAVLALASFAAHAGGGGETSDIGYFLVQTITRTITKLIALF
jgi:hypothetical protein